MNLGAPIFDVPGFDVPGFVAACRASLAERDVIGALASCVARAIAQRQPLLAMFGTGPGLRVTELAVDADLAVMHLASPVGFVFPPHDHRMVSVVGVLAGIEENIYYARRDTGLAELGRRSVRVGEVAAHAEDVVHSIANGSDEEPLVALHVYAGDFLNGERSEWRGDPLREQRYDLARLRSLIARR